MDIKQKRGENILGNAVSFYGSPRGIAGASTPKIKMLESEEIGE